MAIAQRSCLLVLVPERAVISNSCPITSSCRGAHIAASNWYIPRHQLRKNTKHLSSTSETSPVGVHPQSAELGLWDLCGASRWSVGNIFHERKGLLGGKCSLFVPHLSGLPNANAKSPRFSNALSQIAALPPVVALNRSSKSQIAPRCAVFWHAVSQIALASFL